MTRDEAVPVPAAKDPQQTDTAAKRVAVWLILLTILGLCLRFNAAQERAGKYPPQYRGDESSYVMPAIELMRGEFFTDPSRAPGYPLFVAAAFTVLGDDSIPGLVFVQAVLGAAMVPLTYVLALEFVRRRRLALVAAGLAAFDFGLLQQVPILYSEILYTPVLLLGVLYWMRAARRPSTAGFALAGALMGAVTLIRPLTLMFPLVAILGWPREWDWQRKRRATLIYAAGMACVILPFTINNLRVHGRFLPVSLSTAVLWQGSPEFYWRVTSGARLGDIWRNELNPDANGGHDPFTFEGESYFNKRALASIGRDPLYYLWYCVQKGWFFWFGNYFSDVSYAGTFDLATQSRAFGSLGALNQLLWRQLPWVGLAAGVVLYRRREQWGHLFRPALLIAAYMTAMYAATYAGIRYSIPLHPVLIVAAVAAYAALRREAPAHAPNAAPAETMKAPEIAPPNPAPVAPGSADPGLDMMVDTMMRGRRSGPASRTASGKLTRPADH